jgi:hypothetical protein
MDIERFEMDSTRVGIAQNWVGYFKPLAYQARYILNPNYAIVVKQDIHKLLVAGFIQSVEKATWLSPIVVVPKKNGKLRICIDFRKLNTATKKNPYP